MWNRTVGCNCLKVWTFYAYIWCVCWKGIRQLGKYSKRRIYVLRHEVLERNPYQTCVSLHIREVTTNTWCVIVQMWLIQPFRCWKRIADLLSNFVFFETNWFPTREQHNLVIALSIAALFIYTRHIMRVIQYFCWIVVSKQDHMQHFFLLNCQTS